MPSLFAFAHGDQQVVFASDLHRVVPRDVQLLRRVAHGHHAEAFARAFAAVIVDVGCDHGVCVPAPFSSCDRLPVASVAN
jgi:hypothetical protein